MIQDFFSGSPCVCKVLADVCSETEWTFDSHNFCSLLISRLPSVFQQPIVGLCVCVCFSVCNGAESQRLDVLLRWRVFYSVHIARRAFSTHAATTKKLDISCSILLSIDMYSPSGISSAVLWGLCYTFEFLNYIICVTLYYIIYLLYISVLLYCTSLRAFSFLFYLWFFYFQGISNQPYTL